MLQTRHYCLRPSLLIGKLPSGRRLTQVPTPRKSRLWAYGIQATTIPIAWRWCVVLADILTGIGLRNHCGQPAIWRMKLGSYTFNNHDVLPYITAFKMDSDSGVVGEITPAPCLRVTIKVQDIAQPNAPHW